jgi:hypothetical protein
MLPEWMFDPGACSDMSLGPPRASTRALIELHRLLVAFGFRRSPLGDCPVTQEDQNGRSAQKSEGLLNVSPTPHQVVLAFESTQIRDLTRAERQKAIRRLARVLMPAAGISAEENSHER